MRLELPVSPPSDEDQTGWLVTFSDLVLQLFAFVIVAVVLGRQTPATASNGPPQAPLAPALRSPDPAPRPRVVREPLVVETVPAPEETEEEPAADDAPTAIADETPPPPQTASPVERAREEMAAFLKQHTSTDAVSLAVQDASLIVTLGEMISFDSARAQLLEQAQPVLDEIAHLANDLPGYTIEIAGHCDDTALHGGPFASNLELSLARAAAVARALSAHDPALTHRIMAAGYGETRPLASNDDADGRRRNRRVELRFLPIDAARR